MSNSLQRALAWLLAISLSACVPPYNPNLKPSLHRKAGTTWIEYAGHQFRVSNVLDAELGKYGYKIKGRQSAFHAEGDLPTGVSFKTGYSLDVAYDAAATLNRLGIKVPVVAGGETSGGAISTGNYKLYVLKAANEQDWKRVIRQGLAVNDQDLLAQLKRPDGYFRFVDAVLIVSDVTAKQRLDAKLNANATYQSIRAELDTSAHSGNEVTGREPRVIGYSLRGVCWGPPSYSQLSGTPEDLPLAGDSGACQSESEHSPVYLTSPPNKLR